MRRHGVAQRRQHRGPHMGNFFFEILDQSFDARAFQIRLRAAQVAGNDGKLSLSREIGHVAFRGSKTAGE